MKVEKASAYSPKSPKKARIETVDAITIEPKPAGFTAYRYARLNSMYLGLQRAC